MLPSREKEEILVEALLHAIMELKPVIMPLSSHVWAENE
jgi:hypothetical protein